MQPEALAAGRQGQGRHAQRELGAGAGKAVPADGFGSGVENIGSVRCGAFEGLVHGGVALGEAQDIKIEELGPWNGNCGGAPLLEDGDVQSPRLQAQSVKAARVQKNEAAGTRLRFLEKGGELHVREGEDVLYAGEIQSGQKRLRGDAAHADGGDERHARDDGGHNGAEETRRGRILRGEGNDSPGSGKDSARTPEAG